MTTEVTPTTTLQAVNTMLRAVGRAEVMAISIPSLTEDAQAALRKLSDVSVVTQSKGWHFNTEREFPLDPATDGTISLPNNALSTVVSPRSYPLDAAVRGTRLYDLQHRTYKFDKPVFVEMILAFEFEQLSQPFRWYITARAAREFGVGKIPDRTTFQFTKDVEDDAWAALLHHDQDSRGVDLPSTSPHFAAFRRGQRQVR